MIKPRKTINKSFVFKTKTSVFKNKTFIFINKTFIYRINPLESKFFFEENINSLFCNSLKNRGYSKDRTLKNGG